MTRNIRTRRFDLGLAKPEWISMHRALLMLTEPWTPIPEKFFRSVQNLQPPDDVGARRKLITMLASERLPHEGELLQIRQEFAASGKCQVEHVMLIDPQYQVPSKHWMADRVCFGKSQLHLTEPPCDFTGDRVRGDIFKVINLIVRLSVFEVLCGAVDNVTNIGGRPLKQGGKKVAAFISAHIYHGGGIGRAALIAAALEYSAEKLSEKERIGKTNITDIVRAHLDAIKSYLE